MTLTFGIRRLPLACPTICYDAIVAGPPCYTFSRARGYKKGPRHIRSPSSPYGLPKGSLTIPEQQALAEANFFAISTANLPSVATALRVSWIYETPEPSSGVASMLDLEEFRALKVLPGVVRQDFDQCV